MNKLLADRLFDPTSSIAEDELIDAIWKVCGDDNFGDWHWDWYDSSLELTGCKVEFRLPKDILKFLFEQGFDRVWLQHEDNMETYYSKLGGGVENRDSLMPHRQDRNKAASAQRHKVAELFRENVKLKQLIKDKEVTPMET